MDFGDAGGDPLGDALAGRRILKGGIFLGIGDETQLQKGRRSLVMVEDIVTGEFYTATVGTVAPGNFAKDVGGERCGAGIEVIGLHAVCRPSVGPVTVDANEGGVRMGI